MSVIRFSLSIAHTPWIESRRTNLARMLLDLLPLSKDIPYLEHNTDYRGNPWKDVKHRWALRAWRWHLEQDVTHCVLLSDDLAIMPGFFTVLENLVHAAPYHPIGLMSNHPEGPAMFDEGHHWYKTNSWLVGPGMVVPKPLLHMFVRWYEEWYPKLPKGKDAEGYQEFYHDDSSWNEWVTKYWGGYSLHPLPAPIEHTLGLGRSHDPSPFPAYAAESISWRRAWHKNPETFSELPKHVGEQMRSPGWWFGADESPMKNIPGVK
jgi:hypothetical protein